MTIVFAAQELQVLQSWQALVGEIIEQSSLYLLNMHACNVLVIVQECCLLQTPVNLKHVLVHDVTLLLMKP